MKGFYERINDFVGYDTQNPDMLVDRGDGTLHLKEPSDVVVQASSTDGPFAPSVPRRAKTPKSYLDRTTSRNQMSFREAQARRAARKAQLHSVDPGIQHAMAQPKRREQAMVDAIVEQEMKSWTNRHRLDPERQKQLANIQKVRSAKSREALYQLLVEPYVAGMVGFQRGVLADGDTVISTWADAATSDRNREESRRNQLRIRRGLSERHPLMSSIAYASGVGLSTAALSSLRGAKQVAGWLGIGGLAALNKLGKFGTKASDDILAEGVHETISDQMRQEDPANFNGVTDRFMQNLGSELPKTHTQVQEELKEARRRDRLNAGLINELYPETAQHQINPKLMNILGPEWLRGK